MSDIVVVTEGGYEEDEYEPDPPGRKLHPHRRRKKGRGGLADGVMSALDDLAAPSGASPYPGRAYDASED